MAPGPNAEQEQQWNGPAGQGWARRYADVDAMLGEVTERALAALAPSPGTHVLDLGCGSGTTTLRIAAAVAPNGSAVGYDLSEPQIAVARERAHSAALGNVRFERADIQADDLGTGRDLAFSRFGVMFCADPLAVFRNVRQALRPGGRLALLIWRDARENPWFTRPAAELAQRLPQPPPPPPPDAPGPFALADAGRTRKLLEGAGFERVALAPWDFHMRFASPRAAWDLQREISSVLSAAVAALAPPVRADLAAGIEAALAPFQTADGIAVPGAVWWVTGVRPAQ